MTLPALFMASLASMCFADDGKLSLVDKYPKVFAKTDKTFTVTTDARKIVYEDQNVPSGATFQYSADAYDSRLRVATVRDSGHEEVSFIVISLKSGKEIRFEGAPKWRNGVVASATPEKGHEGPGRLDIGYCDTSSCWKLHEEQGYFQNVKHIGKDVVEAVSLKGPENKKTRHVCRIDRGLKTAKCKTR